jgi:hypothetical protein
MSITRKAVAAAAALSLAGVFGAATTLSASTASAATPSCGPKCLDIFNKQFSSYRQPSFVLAVTTRWAKAGQPVILYWQSNNNPGEDFIATKEGTVNQFYQAGLTSGAVNLHYGSDAAYEYEYAPYGVRSGLCVGTATTAAAGTEVSLQPCSVSARTVWIQDSLDGRYPAGWYRGWNGGDLPLINGSDTNFSHPYVLTYPARSFPADHPRAQLYTTNLTGSTVNNDGGPALTGVTSNQLWSWDYGPLH